MQFDEIIKDTNFSDANKPNLLDYSKQYNDFDWNRDAYSKLEWLPDGGLNNAYECVDKHVKNGYGDNLAMIWLGKNGEEEKYSYTDFKNESDKFGQVMLDLGMQKGDRVFIFMDRLPELYFAAMGILKAGGVIAPLFSAFGPDPVKDRMLDAGATYLVTSPELRKKISPILKDIKTLKNVIVVNKDNRFKDPLDDGDLDYNDLMSNIEPGKFKMVNTSQYDFSIMHYTSGSTGKPKGVLHRHQAVVQQMLTGHWALELSHGDIYFCTADPGWVTGTSYGMIAPWTNGVTQIIYEGGFGAAKWYEIIEKYKVDIWYTAPTAIRLLMRAGDDVVKKYNLTSMRFIGSVGEPLNPEAVVWGERNYKLPIHDNWWQTETGAIMCANYPSENIKPGSMGQPFPGITMGILDDEYNELPADESGILAVRPGWPSQMFAYWKQDEMYNSRFKKGWYITGDQAARDKDGYFWFQGRADDVINTAGHLVGPFEVESALIEHPAVAEAGVIGKPDPIAMEIVKAFVTLNPGYDQTPDLRKELIRFSREKLSAGVAPREIDFLETMPKTRSGKIMRRLLKARELGEPEGDISTLEDD